MEQCPALPTVPQSFAQGQGFIHITNQLYFSSSATSMLLALYNGIPPKKLNTMNKYIYTQHITPHYYIITENIPLRKR